MAFGRGNLCTESVSVQKGGYKPLCYQPVNTSSMSGHTESIQCPREGCTDMLPSSESQQRVMLLKHIRSNYKFSSLEHNRHHFCLPKAVFAKNCLAIYLLAEFNTTFCSFHLPVWSKAANTVLGRGFLLGTVSWTENLHNKPLKYWTIVFRT